MNASCSSVWVNNAGVLRLGPAWENSEEDVRIQVEANLNGVIWGSRAAVEAMRAQAGRPGMHLINIGSMSSLCPAPGLTVYSATKHAVLGFSVALQGDLRLAGIPVAVHCLCPDGAETPMLEQQAADDAPAITWTASRILTPEEVAEHAVALLDSRALVRAVPRSRGA